MKSPRGGVDLEPLTYGGFLEKSTSRERLLRARRRRPEPASALLDRSRGAGLGQQPQRERREADHDREHPVLRAHRELGLVVEHQRALVGEDQRRHVAGDDEADLQVPGLVLADQAEVDRRGRGAEEVPALAERVGGERDDALALEDEEGQVVRDHVDQRDRDQRVHEAAAQALRGLLAADRLRARGAERVEPRHQGRPRAAGRSSRPAAPCPGCRSRAREGVGQVVGERRPGLALLEPVEGDGPDHHADHRDGAGDARRASSTPSAAGAGRRRRRACAPARCARRSRSRPRRPRRARSRPRRRRPPSPTAGRRCRPGSARRAGRAAATSPGRRARAR